MINIKNKADCCGCTACVNICHHKAITMEADEEGFLYPKVNSQLCVDCGLCEKVCPIMNRDKETVQQNMYQEYCAVRCKDEEVLYNSSSGGVFSVFADSIIKQGGAVVGAEYSKEMQVQHTVAYNVAGYKKFRGSKYVQSRLGNIFVQIKELLKTGKHVLFTGTPCQVQGLKLFLGKPYDNLITIDLICHAVPSPLIFSQYIDYLNSHYGKRVVWMNMRDKEKRGWGDPHSIRLQFADNQQVVEDLKVVQWNRIYFSRLIDRPSCHHCRFTNFNRAGDLTMADLLDLNNLRPDIRSKKGTSLLIVNTQKGREFYEAVKSSFENWSVTKEEASQPCLNAPIVAGMDREWFWNYYKDHSFKKALNMFFTDTIYARIRRKILRYFQSAKNRNQT